MKKFGMFDDLRLWHDVVNGVKAPLFQESPLMFKFEKENVVMKASDLVLNNFYDFYGKKVRYVYTTIDKIHFFSSVENNIMHTTLELSGIKPWRESLKLEVGKFYKDGAGDRVEILCKDGDCFIGRERTGRFSARAYKVDGNSFSQDASHPANIISIWEEPKPKITTTWINVFTGGKVVHYENITLAIQEARVVSFVGVFPAPGYEYTLEIEVSRDRLPNVKVIYL